MNAAIVIFILAADPDAPSLYLVREDAPLRLRLHANGVNELRLSKFKYLKKARIEAVDNRDSTKIKTLDAAIADLKKPPPPLPLPRVFWPPSKGSFGVIAKPTISVVEVVDENSFIGTVAILKPTPKGSKDPFLQVSRRVVVSMPTKDIKPKSDVKVEAVEFLEVPKDPDSEPPALKPVEISKWIIKD